MSEVDTWLAHLIAILCHLGYADWSVLNLACQPKHTAHSKWGNPQVPLTQGFVSLPLVQLLESSAPLNTPTLCHLADKKAQLTLTKRRKRFGHSGIYEEGTWVIRACTVSGIWHDFRNPLPPPWKPFSKVRPWSKERFGHRKQSGGFGDSTLLQDGSFRHSCRHFGGFGHLTLLDKTLVGPCTDMFLIMLLECVPEEINLCVPEEINLRRSLSPSVAAFQKQLDARWGLVRGVVHQRPLGAIGYLLLGTNPPMNGGKVTKPLSQTLCKGVTLALTLA